jgi:hypothetical protein
LQLSRKTGLISFCTAIAVGIQRLGSAPASGAAGDALVAGICGRSWREGLRREGAPRDSRGGCAPQKIAGALLLLPFGASTLRILRRRTA